MMGLKKSSRKLGFKSKSTGPWGDGDVKDSADGVGLCGHYDVELDSHGYCRDENCKHERLVKALYNGEAMMTKNGTLVWTPGSKIRDVK